MAGRPCTPAAAETHISTVFFTADRAYKLLKPITTPYLDYSGLDARLDAIDNEFTLNRRIAPDVYLGTADVIEHGERVDRFLVMRRMPDDRRLATIASAQQAAGDGLDRCLRAVAKTVAGFHAAQPPLPDAVDIAGRDAVRGNWNDNVVDMAPLVGEVFDEDEFERVRRLAFRYLDFSADLFAGRLEGGFVRDGHGDLTAEDIFCLDDGPRILDCLAFAPRLRIADVLADIAFLVMDMDRLAGPRAASALWGYYAEFSNEHHPASLAEHYVAYRAHVRAKIAGLRYRQGEQEAAELARSYLHLARRHLERAKRQLIVIGGTAGTGKSTLARSLSDSLNRVAIGSDALRKELTGRTYTDRDIVDVDAGIYSPEISEQTYDELFRRASVLLAEGESVIVDASFNSRTHRDAARRLAADAGADLIELECVLDPGIAKQRVAIRLQQGVDASDARPELLDALRAQQDRWPEAARIDTSGTPAESASAALAVIAAAS